MGADIRAPYFVCELVEDNRGATAAEIVAAMVANEALATTGVVDVEIGGLTGKQFDVRLNPDWTEHLSRRPAGFRPRGRPALVGSFSTPPVAACS